MTCSCSSRSIEGGFLPLNCSRGLGFLLEDLQQTGPAAIDVLAHLLASLGAHLLELAMFELDARRIRAVGNESNLHLGTDRRVGLPLAVDVPRHDEAPGRLPDN